MDQIRSQSSLYTLQKQNCRIYTATGVRYIYQLYPFLVFQRQLYYLLIKNYKYQPFRYHKNMQNFSFSPEKVLIYNQKISNIINKLNQLKEAQIQINTEKLLNELKGIDYQFMKSHGIQCKGHLCFTRHGQCKNWSEKIFGINPNAALAQEAVSAMARTHKLTNQILFFQQQVCIVRISPLIRAKQTASLVLPHKRRYDIKLQFCLTQNSAYPSGKFITSKEQLRQNSQKSSIFSHPVSFFTYKMAQLFYSKQNVFQKMQQISLQTNKKLLNISNQENDAKLLQNLKQNKKDLNKIQKVKEMKQIIEYQLKEKSCDMWFFGHSNNIKTFFNALFGRNTRLQYGETRRIYRIYWNKQWLYFQPSYNFIVNQQSGLINGKYTPEWFKASSFINVN